MKIRFFGQRSTLGFGIHFSEFFDSFSGLNIIGDLAEAVDLTNQEALDLAISTTTPNDVNIWFWRHPARSKIKGIHIVWSIFECDRLDSQYIESHKQYAHYLWTPSEWAKSVLVKSGYPEERIDVVPEGVNPATFHPLLRNMSTSQPRVFNFLMVGKYEERKAYDVLFKSFLRAFENDPSVILTIKADFFIRHSESKDELEQLIKDMKIKTVRAVWGKMDSRALFTLYNNAHSFVFPSRAEGWGLPLIEALAMGVPVVSTCYSGHEEYLRAIDGQYMKIDHSITPIQDEMFYKYWPNIKGLGANWAQPDEHHLSSLLKTARERYQINIDRAVQASEAIRSKFSWLKAAETAVTTLRRRNIISVSQNK